MCAPYQHAKRHLTNTAVVQDATCGAQLASGETSAVEVVCPWSNTEQTLIESMDEDDSLTFETHGGPTNGHTVAQLDSQVQICVVLAVQTRCLEAVACLPNGSCCTRGRYFTVYKDCCPS